MLKNKETGDIVTGYVRVGVQNDEKFPNPIAYYTYNSIAELNEKWEDYEPTEPLIKDPKIRKAVRAWAEANGIKDVVCYATEYGFKFAGNPISLEICFNQPLEIDTDGIYTIAELCGEEEECD